MEEGGRGGFFLFPFFPSSGSVRKGWKEKGGKEGEKANSYSLLLFYEL